jgi:hypothetical protein
VVVGGFRRFEGDRRGWGRGWRRRGGVRGGVEFLVSVVVRGVGVFSMAAVVTVLVLSVLGVFWGWWKRAQSRRVRPM